jgi:hypothetical protein
MPLPPPGPPARAPSPTSPASACSAICTSSPRRAAARPRSTRARSRRSTASPRLLAVGERAIAGGTKRNRAYAETFTTWGSGIPPAQKWLVCDAMTSGGLLAAVDPERAAEIPGTVVGRLTEGDAGTIAVR